MPTNSRMASGFFKQFVRASGTDSSVPDPDKPRSSRSKGKGIPGKDAQSFYDKLVGLANEDTDQVVPANERPKPAKASSDGTGKPYPDRSRCATFKPGLSSQASTCTRSTLGVDSVQSERQLWRLHTKFLKNAQEGDLDQLKRCWTSAFDNVPVFDMINFADQYGWTALMCAACSGHKSTTRWLLEQGANSSLMNNKGQTAKDLAKSRSITRLLARHMSGGSIEEVRKKDPVQEKFFCDLCRQEFTDTTWAAHQTSMVHLFSKQQKPQSTSYYIPPSNRGFQLMVKGGWEPEQGLGPEGQGRKYPVKTVLKRDRQGLGGSEDKPAKVTHFDPKDTAAVKHVAPTERIMKTTRQSKMKRQKELTKNRAKERDFRLQFYTD